MLSLKSKLLILFECLSEKQFPGVFGKLNIGLLKYNQVEISYLRDRVYTPHLPAKIPSLDDLIAGNGDMAVQIPSQLPAVTPKSEAVNSHQFRFSDTPLHENLHSNIADSIMSYTRYPFPATVSPALRKKYGRDSPYRIRELVREWVEDIFVRNGHDKLLELNTTVEKAEKIDDKWVLTLRKEEPAKSWWWSESFDALVVASGHYNVPWLPKIPGLLEYDTRFPERLIHSKHFRNAKSYKGKVCGRFVQIG
jgi:hypothetical protein